MELIFDGGSASIYYDGKYVIKYFEYYNDNTWEYLFNNEIYILEKLKDNKYIIQIIKYDKKKRQIFIEYAQNGNLYDYILENKNVSIEIKYKWIYQLVCSIKILHDHDIVYGDFKTMNILLDVNKNIKLCDFESSFFINNVIEYNYFVTDKYYNSPEWSYQTKYFKESNIYTLGLIIIEIWNLKNIREYNYLLDKESFINMPLYLKDIVNKCLDKNPDERPKINIIKDILEENYQL